MDKRFSSSSALLKSSPSLTSPKKEILFKVIEGKGLPVKASHVFCVISLLDNEKRVGKEYKTSIKKSPHAVWNEIFHIATPSSFTSIRISLQSKQKLISKTIGQFVVVFEESFMKAEKTIDGTFELFQNAKGKVSKSSSNSLTVGKLSILIIHGSKGEGLEGKVVTLDGEVERKKNRNVLKQTNYVVVKGGIDPNSKHLIVRDGPRATELVAFDKSSLSIINEEILQIENTTTDQVQICTGNVRVRGNKWYFETTIHQISEDGKVYIGWISDKFKTWGDKTGWFWNSNGKKKCGSLLDDAGEAWRNEDVIGCALDLFKGRITFTKNGKVHAKYSDIKRSDRCGDHFVPAFAFEKSAKINANFGHKFFQYQPEAYFPLHYQLGTDDRSVLENLFENYLLKDVENSTSESYDYPTTSASENSEEVVESSDSESSQHYSPENSICPNLRGSLQYFCDLDIDFATDMLSVLVMSWKLNINKAFCFTRDEFIIGWSVAGCKTLPQMKQRVAEWKKLAETEQFIPFYYYCRKFFSDKKARGVLAVDALRVWNIVLLDNNWPHFEAWKSFIKKECPVINTEVWNVLPLFMEQYNSKFDGFDPDKWPKAYSSFVDSFSSNTKV